MDNKEMKTGKRLPASLAVAFALYILSLALWLCAYLSKDFAEWLSVYLSGAFRFLLAKLTSPIPFSLAEFTIYFLISLALLILFNGIFLAVFRKKETAERNNEPLGIYIRRVICVFLVFLSLFNMNIGVCYMRKTLDENLSLTKRKVTDEELAGYFGLISEHLSEYEGKINYKSSGESKMPYSFHKMNRILNESYQDLSKKYKFINHFSAPVKKIAASPLLSYTCISGIYFPFTGEANVNIDYPDFVIAFSAAHEMAHQRGIAREDEANFMAFLSCINSGDDYLSYSAYLNLYTYFANALAKEDAERYYQVVLKTPFTVKRELNTYYDYIERFVHSKASAVSSVINDTYLKTQGQKDGQKSYGNVVDLAIAYFDNTKAVIQDSKKEAVS